MRSVGCRRIKIRRAGALRMRSRLSRIESAVRGGCGRRFVLCRRLRVPVVEVGCRDPDEQRRRRIRGGRRFALSPRRQQVRTALNPVSLRTALVIVFRLRRALALASHFGRVRYNRRTQPPFQLIVASPVCELVAVKRMAVARWIISPEHPPQR